MSGTTTVILRRIVATLAVVAWLLPMRAVAELPRAVARAFLDHGVPLDHVALVVQQVGKPRPLFAHDADHPMNPASVIKLVTTFAALELLGRDYRWKTEAYLGGALSNGVLKGDLILKGYGDPKITLEQWQWFIAKLRANGLEAIEGDLALDRSFFALPTYDPGAVRRRAAQAVQRRSGRAARQLQVGSTDVRAGRERRVGHGQQRAAARRSRARAAAFDLRCGLRRLAQRAQRVVRESLGPGAGLVRRSLCGKLRRARLVGGAARPSALRARDLHVGVPRRRGAIRRRPQGAPSAARFVAVRAARIAAALRHRARRQQAFQQRDGAPDLPHARRGRGLRLRPRRPRPPTPSRAGRRRASCRCRGS